MQPRSAAEAILYAFPPEPSPCLASDRRCRSALEARRWSAREQQEHVMKISLTMCAAVAALIAGSLSAEAACVTRWHSQTGTSGIKSMKVPPLARLQPG